MECVTDVRKAFNKKRNAYLRTHPVCVRCGCDAEEVHHIHPIVYGGGNEDTNLASLCCTCHKEYDVWEGAWVATRGFADFETLFGIFCCAPSTKAVAAFYLSTCNKQAVSSAEQEIMETFDILRYSEIKINYTRRRIKNAV